MIAKWYPGGLVTVANANGFVCLQVSEAEALKKLKARGLSLEKAQSVLNREVPAAEWRATFVQAAAATAVALEESLANVPESSDLDEIRKSQETLGDALATVEHDVAVDRRRQEMTNLESHLNATAQQMRETLIARHIRPRALEERIIWQHLWETPEGIRLQELREVL